MIDYINNICNRENLYWAWKKASNMFRSELMWFNVLEISSFEANLDDELSKIANLIKNGKYKLDPIKPIAYPKLDNNGETSTRQMFSISVRDQVTWIATINIIGPHLDYLMPSWSYGHRLYRSVYYTEDKELKIGWYRNSVNNIYRKWTQSWPLFRRHIYMTSKIMANNKIFNKNPDKFANEEFDEFEKEDYKQNEKFANDLKVKYLTRDYWNINKEGIIYWGAIDLEKFYPNINLIHIQNNFNKYLPEYDNYEKLKSLIKNLLSFEIDSTGWNKRELEEIQPYSRGIPTGLFVAGFLANLALLDTDILLSKKILKNKNVAHFRYVDDHVILTYDFDLLKSWIVDYENILSANNSGAKVKLNKIEPIELQKLFIKNNDRIVLNNTISDDIIDKAKKSTFLDPQFPTPLMTQTLTKISIIAKTEFDLLDNDEKESIIADLEHLMVAEFNDNEIRRETRVAFASAVLSKITPDREIDFSDIYKLENEILIIDNEINETIKRITPGKLQKSYIDELNNKKNIIKRERIKAYNNYNKKKDICNSKTNKLLLKAIYDNHDKIKLWSRFVEYERRTGCSNIIQLFTLLKKLKLKKLINDINCEFLVSFILINISIQLIKAIKLIGSDYSSLEQQENSVKFIKSIINPQLLKVISETKDTGKYYNKLSHDIFNFTAGCIIFLLKRIRSINNYYPITGGAILPPKTDYLIKKYKIIDWENDNSLIRLKGSYTIGSWMWWILKNIGSADINKSDIVWRKTLSLLDINNTVDCSIIAMFPNNVPSNILFNVFQSNITSTYFMREGWIYDSLISNDNAYRNYNKITILNRVKDIIKKSSLQNKYITLLQWQQFIDANYISNTHDPRYSEWTALEIIRQIIMKERNKIVIKYIKNPKDLLKNDNRVLNIHPANYLISTKWTDLTNNYSWEEWKLFVKEETIKKAKESKCINDDRLTPEFYDPFNVPSVELSAINGIGIILCCLLCRDFRLTPEFNLLGLQRKSVGSIIRKLQYHSISSFTSKIIQGCFSVKNKETKFIKIYQENLKKLSDDTNYDPPDIYNLLTFEKLIIKSQSILDKYQLSVSEKAPRQLIPITFKSILREDIDL